MGKLDGKVALVTGASMGLGKEIARAFLAEGAAVALCSRHWSTLMPVVAELDAPYANQPDRPRHAIGMSCNVSDPREALRFFMFACHHFGRVDILVNNAGVHGYKGALEGGNWSEWLAAIQTNLYGPALLMGICIPPFQKQGHGKIINISGGGATKPMYGLSAYAASKAALVRLTETVALELAGTGIDVNAVAPGALNTRLLDDILEAGPDKVGEKMYQEKLKQRETGGDDICRAADLCVFLASAESDGVTGRLISAKWDDWDSPAFTERLANDADLYTLRRRD